MNIPKVVIHEPLKAIIPPWMAKRIIDEEPSWFRLAPEICRHDGFVGWWRGAEVYESCGMLVWQEDE